jgi:hypothetical protein
MLVLTAGVLPVSEQKLEEEGTHGGSWVYGASQYVHLTRGHMRSSRP